MRASSWGRKWWARGLVVAWVLASLPHEVHAVATPCFGVPRRTSNGLLENAVGVTVEVRRSSDQSVVTSTVSDHEGNWCMTCPGDATEFDITYGLCVGGLTANRTCGGILPCAGGTCGKVVTNQPLCGGGIGGGGGGTAGICSGGTNAGGACSAASACPGGVCNVGASLGNTTAVPIGDATGSAGVGSTASRIDHDHQCIATSLTNSGCISASGTSTTKQQIEGNKELAGSELTTDTVAILTVKPQAQCTSATCGTAELLSLEVSPAQGTSPFCVFGRGRGLACQFGNGTTDPVVAGNIDTNNNYGDAVTFSYGDASTPYVLRTKNANSGKSLRGMVLHMDALQVGGTCMGGANNGTLCVNNSQCSSGNCDPTVGGFNEIPNAYGIHIYQGISDQNTKSYGFMTGYSINQYFEGQAVATDPNAYTAGYVSRAVYGIHGDGLVAPEDYRFVTDVGLIGDGTCSGGSRAGLSCLNTAACPSGTCNRTTAKQSFIADYAAKSTIGDGCTGGQTGGTCVTVGTRASFYQADGAALTADFPYFLLGADPDVPSQLAGPLNLGFEGDGSISTDCGGGDPANDRCMLNVNGYARFGSNGIQFTAGDGILFPNSIPTCNGTASDYSIYVDANTQKFKKCQNGTLSDLDTGGGGGSGTVTSVALSAPSFLTVSGSPVTTSGTLALTATSQAANTGLHGPVSGGSAAPTFRTAVAADLPTMTSAELAGKVSDETGTGLVPLATNPALTGPILGAVTVAGLPAASGTDGRLYIVTNGTSTTDCGTGGGSSLVLCRDNGASWAAVAGGTGTGVSLGGSAPQPVGNGAAAAGSSGNASHEDHIHLCTSASATVKGCVDTAAQSFTGVKTFGAYTTYFGLVSDGQSTLRPNPVGTNPELVTQGYELNFKNSSGADMPVGSEACVGATANSIQACANGSNRIVGIVSSAIDSTAIHNNELGAVMVAGSMVAGCSGTVAVGDRLRAVSGVLNAVTEGPFVGVAMSVCSSSLLTMAIQPGFIPSDKRFFPVGACATTTASLAGGIATSNAASCVAGTNQTRAVVGFPTNVDTSLVLSTMLPVDWDGVAPDVRVHWEATGATDGTDVVVWTFQTACVGTTETDDPVFNTAGTSVTGTASTANRTITTRSAGNIPMTGCLAGEMLYLRVIRNGLSGTDTYDNDAQLTGVAVTFIRG